MRVFYTQSISIELRRIKGEETYLDSMHNLRGASKMLDWVRISIMTNYDDES